jgi:outer membrane protein assembly factor BamB
MCRSLALALAAIAVVVFTTGCPNKAPKVPVRPIGPDSVPAETTATYRTVTDDPNKDQVLYVFDWDDGTYDTTDYGSSGDTVEGSHDWFTMKPYGVRVKAKDDVGNWSAWSDTHLVVVGDTVNRPPRPSMPWGDSSGVINTEYTFYAYAMDANGDSFRIRFYWGDDVGLGDWSGWMPSGDTFSDKVTYANPGIKSIKAIAEDPHGASDTSEAFDFRVTTGQPNEAPLKPTIQGPVKGIASGPAYRFWASANDPDGQPVRYIFNWGDGSVDTTAFGISRGDTAAHQFASDGDYQITVTAEDDSMAASEPSDPHGFMTVGEGEIIWYHRIDEGIVSSPALAEVTNVQGYPTLSIVLGVQDGSVLALEALNCTDTSGVEAYRVFPIEAEDFFASPAAGTDGFVYIGNSNGHFYVFDKTGGLDTSWADPNHPLAELDPSPILDGEMIYVAGSAGKLYKLTYDGTNLTKDWEYAAKDEIQSSPAMGPSGSIVFCDDSGYVHSVNASGTANWTYNVNENITSSPAVGSNGTVYFGTEQGKMYAVSSSGSLVRDHTIEEPNVSVLASPVIDAAGNVYFAADNGTVYKFNSVLERQKQTAITRSSITATPALSATGILYVVAEDDTLYWVDISDLSVSRAVELKIPTAYGSRGGRLRSTAVEDLWPSPVIDMYGIVYAVTDEGDVFAVAGSGALAPAAAWPMFRHDVRHTGKSGSW